MSRRKQTAAPAPADAAEAIGMIRTYVELDREAALERLAAQSAIDQIQHQLDEALSVLELEKATLFAGIKAWWEAGGKDEVAKGKRSAAMAGAKIGIRLTPPKVKLKRGVKLGDVIAWLEDLPFGDGNDFLRTKTELDKPAVIRAIHTDADAEVIELFGPRLTVEQADEFFIDTGLNEDELRKELALFDSN
ncbi:MAG: hypothetical protein C0496_09400 [Erythrobacter sp.]|nr:hypothetical protein [Erythrobacter sp.]